MKNFYSMALLKLDRLMSLRVPIYRDEAIPIFLRPEIATAFTGLAMTVHQIACYKAVVLCQMCFKDSHSALDAESRTIDKPGFLPSQE